MPKKSQNSFTRVWVKDAPYNGPITLGKELGAGGEGAVHDVRNKPDLVAKIYHPERRVDNVIKKLELMIKYPPRTEDESSGSLYVAWPSHLVYDRANKPVGFIMPKVNKRNSLFDYYNPSQRKRNAQHVNYASLCKVARNLAKALDEMHGRGYVIGDINESNAYIVEGDNVTLIDSDSFQVRDYQTTPNTIYRCTVGKPEYTPPELQGISFKDVDRAPVHDRFALAVVIYQLLMEGRHPFRGIYKGAGEPLQVETHISRGNFLHTKHRTVPLVPAPTAVPWSALHPDVKDLFTKCFEKGHADPQSRPGAQEWAVALERAMRDLRQCKVNSNHWYFGNKLNSASGMGCTWCVRPIEAFPAQHKTTSFVPTGAHKKLSTQPGPSQKTKPHTSTTHKKPNPTPDYKLHKPEKWSTWVHDNIEEIRKKPVPDGADKTVVHYLRGTHYRYTLEFPVVRNWLRRSLGTPKVYRRPRTWYWESKPKWYWKPKPQWKLLGKGGRDNDGSERIYGPPWIKKFIRNIINNSGGSLGDGVYHLKGKRYRYKVIIEYLGHGGWRTDTYRKQRTWYWKKLNS